MLVPLLQATETDDLTPLAHFFGFMGVAIALSLANLGAAIGTWKSGVGVSTMGVMYPAMIMRNMIPVVMAGVLGIYGLIVSVMINQKISEHNYDFYLGFAHFASGLTCGLSALGSGMAIGIVGEAGVRANGQQPKLFVGMVLVLVFAGAQGLYGLIGAIYLTQQN